MNSFKKNPNLNFILGKGGVGGGEEGGGLGLVIFLQRIQT